jgi:hypothetical protein
MSLMNRAERRRLKSVSKDRRKIWLAIPSYGNSICVLTMKSLMNDMHTLVQRGDIVKVFDELGHADIYHLRAQIVSHFLSDPDATDLVMIDSDVGWGQGSLVRLLDHDVDMVGGAYPKRVFPLQIMWRDDGGPLSVDTGSGLAKVWGLPGGFLRIKRHVLEKMDAAYADEFAIHDKNVPSGRTVRMFDPYYLKNPDGTPQRDANGLKKALGEDYSFCQRWRDLGGEVHMDVTISMGHVGTHTWAGCPASVLLAQKQEEKAA